MKLAKHQQQSQPQHQLQWQNLQLIHWNQHTPVT